MTRYQAKFELKGHILDSLTLSKVIDLIQQNGLDYELSHLRIGQDKADLSSATLVLYSESEAQLSLVAKELSPHGAEQIV
jgi:hypothetical protein